MGLGEGIQGLGRGFVLAAEDGEDDGVRFVGRDGVEAASLRSDKSLKMATKLVTLPCPVDHRRNIQPFRDQRAILAKGRGHALGPGTGELPLQQLQQGQAHAGAWSSALKDRR